MATRDELTAQLEALQGQLADLDENDYECVVEIEGKKTGLRGKTAKGWLLKHGLIDAPADGGDGDGDGDGDGGKKDPPPAKSGSKFFD